MVSIVVSVGFSSIVTLKADTVQIGSCSSVRLIVIVAVSETSPAVALISAVRIGFVSKSNSKSWLITKYSPAMLMASGTD